ncbi:hypothetical protein CDL15_Pgr027059 [Punica granatum]|uniref:Uncharacterized protein n=1 Tax=Punica granatum TaxID=22663 RepID=A0A218XHN8_PUNGR|nr:hypothetical protein CDL15_Pgr027059 [Punica granatum]
MRTPSTPSSPPSSPKEEVGQDSYGQHSGCRVNELIQPLQIESADEMVPLQQIDSIEQVSTQLPQEGHLNEEETVDHRPSAQDEIVSISSAENSFQLSLGVDALKSHGVNDTTSEIGEEAEEKLARTNLEDQANADIKVDVVKSKLEDEPSFTSPMKASEGSKKQSFKVNITPFSAPTLILYGATNSRLRSLMQKQKDDISLEAIEEVTWHFCRLNEEKKVCLVCTKLAFQEMIKPSIL